MASPFSRAALAGVLLLLAGCGGRMPGQTPAGTTPVQAAQANAIGEPSGDPEEPLVPADVLIRLFANGSAVSAGPNPQFISFSIQATEDPFTGLTHGSLFISDSFRNLSFFGTITSGNLTHASEAKGGATGGTGNLRGILARGAAFNLKVADRNSRTQRDTITFQVPGQFSFTGQVFRRDLAIVRAARPMRPFEISPPGTFFNSAIGMHLLTPDAFIRRGPQLPIPRRLLELTPPEPVIDFQRNREGGANLPPGSEDNVPNANPDVEPFVTPYANPEEFPNNNSLGEEG